jgi:hypothetical protein
MGEYVKYGNKTVKLGTCENLYYVTLPQLQANVGLMSFVEGNLEPHAYLDPASGFRYRFPFPDEDGTPVGEYDNYERGLQILLLDQYAPNLVKYLRQQNTDADNNFDHNDKWLSVGNSHYGYAINVKIPCPLTDKFRKSGIETSLSGASNVVLLTQQKQVTDKDQNQVIAIIDCLYCGAKWRLNRSLARELADCVIQDGHRHSADSLQWYLTVADRIMAGYSKE